MGLFVRVRGQLLRFVWVCKVIVTSPASFVRVRGQLLRHYLRHTPTAPSLDYEALASVRMAVAEGEAGLEEDSEGRQGGRDAQLSAADVCGVARDAALLALQTQVGSF